MRCEHSEKVDAFQVSVIMVSLKVNFLRNFLLSFSFFFVFNSLWPHSCNVEGFIDISLGVRWCLLMH